MANITFLILIAVTAFISLSSCTSHARICDLVHKNETYSIQDMVDNKSRMCSGDIELTRTEGVIRWKLGDIYKLTTKRDIRQGARYLQLSQLHCINSHFQVKFEAWGKLILDVNKNPSTPLYSTVLCTIKVGETVMKECHYPKEFAKVRRIRQEHNTIVLESDDGTQEKWENALILFVNTQFFNVEGGWQGRYIRFETC